MGTDGEFRRAVRLAAQLLTVEYNQKLPKSISSSDSHIQNIGRYPRYAIVVVQNFDNKVMR